MKNNPNFETEIVENLQSSKLAIVGMEAFLGSYNGLDAFERSVYGGKSQGMEERHQFAKSNGNEGNKHSLETDRKDFRPDNSCLEIPPDEVDKLNYQQLVITNVANNALKDAGLKKGANVAVFITTELQISVEIENRLSDYICTLWNFSNISLTINVREDSFFTVLGLAQTLLINKEVDAVLLGAVELSGEIENVSSANGGAAVVLKLYETAKQSQERIYAVIDAISLLQKNSVLTDFEAAMQACQQAFTMAGVAPIDINYLEFFGDERQESESEIKGLIQAYQTSAPDLSCAIFSAKASTADTYATSEIASIIRTALCLYHRYIPASPQLSSSKDIDIWQGSCFYVTPESKPWFLEKDAFRRVAAINKIGLNETYAHLILSEEPNQQERCSKYLVQTPFYLFPIAADDRSTLLDQIRTLEQTIEDSSSLFSTASQTFAIFHKHSQATYALAILGHNKEELLREIQRALKGVANAFDKEEDWQTPVGSYFTAKPLGKQGAVAYVYPGAFNSYIGLGRDVFRLFPQLYDRADSRVDNIGLVLREKLLYPRSLHPLTRRQLEALEQQLMNDSLALFESGMGFAGLFTMILRDYFKIQPKYTFGYSLGEISMMCAQEVWTCFDQGSDALNSSPLFGTRLRGPKNAAREYWGLPQGDEGEDFWSTYVLISPVSRVKECLKHENRVYLLLINTSEEVVIAGDPKACLRVIEALKCDAFRAPFNHIIHCEAMRSEYHELVKLNTLPIQKVPEEVIFYSAAECAPITLDSQSIGENLAKALCETIDFPRLVNKAYEDGSRIFIETGAESNCSRWIGEILKQRQHVTVSVSRRGVNTQTSIVRALAKLLSHRVSLDLSPLYCQAPQSPVQGEPVVKARTLHEIQDTSNIFNTQNNKALKNASLNSLIQNPVEQQIPTKNEYDVNTLKTQAKTVSISDNTTKQDDRDDSIFITTTHKVFHQSSLPDLRNPQYQKLSENNSRLTQAHAAFLQARQESLRQISNIIQFQTALSQKLLDQESLLKK
jgi:PfaB family protein